MSEALQHSLLTPPAQTDGVQVSVRYQPAAVQMHVGGDWYDSFEMPHGGLGLAIGDVTGHDRRAAAAMAQVRNLLRGIAVTLHDSPSFVLTALDNAMRTLAVDAFATVVFAHLEQTEHRWTLHWSNAGHPPPVLIAPDGTATLLHTPVDVMLGVHTGAPRRDHVVSLAPGCTVVLYTDGLVDRRGVIIDDGLADLTRTLTGSQHMSAEQLSEHLLVRYASTGEDDIALVVLRIPADVDPHA